MHRHRRLAALAVAAFALAACNKPPATSDAPLAFAPADTPYAYANLEPVPAAFTDAWSRPMQDYWPQMFTMYQTLLDDAKPGLDPRTSRIAHALLDEVRTHAGWDKLKEIGLKPDGKVALYGVGLVPVLRLELGNADAFRAEIAKVEKAAGETLPVAKTGTQEYWQVGNGRLAAAIAIVNSHLVVSLLPPNADDKLKQTLLGLARPAQDLASAGTLEQLARQKGYSPHGAGFVDFGKLVARLSKPLEGSDAEFASALGLPALSTDDACRAEFADIAHTFPRLTIGAEEMSAQRLRVATQFEIEGALAQRFAAAIGAAPGSADANVGAIDIGVALPVLKLRDFWVAQAQAVAARPYRCAALSALNDMFAESKAKVDVTVPPPFSDLTGLRVTLDRFVAGSAGAMPDFAGKLLIGSSNPLAALAMAQLAVPGLQKLKLAADSKPVAVPADIVPVKTPPLFAAMSDKAIALAAGADQSPALGAYLSAPAAKDAVFVRLHFSGIVYAWMAQSFATMKSVLPPEKQKEFELQEKLFATYQKWLRASDIGVTAAADGIVMRQSIELNTP